MGRGDSWGEAVYVQIQNVGDQVVAEAKSHYKQVAFISLCKQIDDRDTEHFWCHINNLLGFQT